MVDAFALALTHFPLFGPASLQKLFSIFPSSEAVWRASLPQLLASGIKPTTVEGFAAWRHTVDPTELAKKVAACGVAVVDAESALYPPLLKTIHDPPFLLFVKGELRLNPTLAVVGTRQPSLYGLEATKALIPPLARAGITIVSGLAHGIDAAAHQATLDAGGHTVAVLGCGHEALDATKQELADLILQQGGAIISEYPPHVESQKHHFPIRNRLIAGMSKAVLVIEANQPSGSLITARAAIAENRDVFAVPGPITSLSSAGTNDLLKDGAHLVTEARDILEVLGLAQVTARKTVSLPELEDPNEQAVVSVLSATPLHLNDLARQLNQPVSNCAATLSMLEIKGYVRHVGGLLYVLAN